MSMLLNILYYDQTSEAKKTNSASLSLGPFYITPEQVCLIIFVCIKLFIHIQIGIGVIVELFSFVPSLLLIQLFRRIRPRQSHQQHSSLGQIFYGLKQQPIL